ncbi:HNH endonuclease signature motif containing protein [Aeromonas hydrophila]|uniref:HNH endonuclease signature motif containing protein n=1 Tax=Aeromonas hydrophila TaxID=644 RepID=UPI002361BCB7|nr:HNH endonuclease signature motif containing protein [Aeromonas hydrophila]
MFNFNEIFAYCNQSGVLTFRVKAGKMMPGCVAGCANSKGYLTVGINRKKHYVHRIIWEMFNSKIPDGMQIDHINGNKSDNRLENLRLASNQVNSKNQKRKSTNSSGLTGVSWDSQTGMWRAHITVNGKMKSLGRYKDKESALLARKDADARYYFHKNHGRHELKLNAAN